MTDRDAFEAWFQTSYDWKELRPIEDGCYVKRGAGMAWDAWQAATKAERERCIKVCEKVLESFESPLDSEFYGGAFDCIEAIKELP